MKEWLRKQLQEFLGIDRVNERLVIVEQHFVTKRDPASGHPTETLADKHAREDGRKEPGLIRGRRNWDQTRRFLESRDMAAAASKVRK